MSYRCICHDLINSGLKDGCGAFWKREIILQRPDTVLYGFIETK